VFTEEQGGNKTDRIRKNTLSIAERSSEKEKESIWKSSF